MLSLFKKHVIFIFCLFIFILFLARDPFSSRTLIPNFEPYPDTLHYVVPARNFVINNQFAIVREGSVIIPRVPPLYSLFLIPFYSINSDPRFFYFANVFLALSSFFLFYSIITHLITHNLHLNDQNTKQLIPSILTFISLFLYVANYFNYWYPTLAMSENLTIFLFLLNLFVLTKPINKSTAIIGGILPFSFFITKFAHAPLTAVFLIMYAVKIINEIGWKKQEKIKKYGVFFGCSALITFLLFLFFDLIPFSAFTGLFAVLIPKKTSEQATGSGGAWFSLLFMKEHLPKYIRALFGGYSVRFLWDNTPIVPIYIGIPGMIGLVLGIFNKQIRLLASTLILTLITAIIFMSTFYSLDMRYLYQVIPTILIGFVMFWIFIFDKLQILNSKSYSNHKLSNSKKKVGLKFGIFNLSRLAEVLAKQVRFWGLGFSILLLLIFGFYLATNVIRFKKQIMLNLKYAETPWYYLSVIKLNDYFKNYPQDKPVPVVISSIIPYFIDFYSNGNYSLLPLSLHQEFRDNRKEAWGDFDYRDLVKLYYKVLMSGHEVYVHNYGLGNEKVLHDDFKKIQDNFIMTKVADGCYGACDIWKLKMKWGVEWLKKKD